MLPRALCASKRAPKCDSRCHRGGLVEEDAEVHLGSIEDLDVVGVGAGTLNKKRSGIAAAEEDLCFGDLIATDGEYFDIAMALTGLQFVFVHDEYIVVVGSHDMQ